MNVTTDFRLLGYVILGMNNFYILLLAVVLITLRTAYRNTNTPDAGTLDSDARNLQVFSFSKIKEATNNFSNENKIGEGGFGILYKVKTSIYFTTIL